MRRAILVLACIAVGLASCAPPAPEIAHEVVPATGENPEYWVLFTSPEGCKLYKVRDRTPAGDSAAYMTVCPNDVSASAGNVLATY